MEILQYIVVGTIVAILGTFAVLSAFIEKHKKQ